MNCIPAANTMSSCQLIMPGVLSATQEREREITIRPRNASKVDGTHLEFSLEVLHIQTTASTNTRQQPSDPHAKRTISWWNVHPERHEHIAVEYAQMQGTQKQDAVHPPVNGQGNAGRPSWPWARPPSGPAQWAVNGRSSESGKADAGCPWTMATESTAPPQVQAARTIDGMCKAWHHD